MLSLAAITLFAISLSSYAEEVKNKEGKKKAESKADLLQKYDSNKDGKIDKAERAHMSKKDKKKAHKTNADKKHAKKNSEVK